MKKTIAFCAVALTYLVVVSWSMLRGQVTVQQSQFASPFQRSSDLLQNLHSVATVRTSASQEPTVYFALTQSDVPQEIQVLENESRAMAKELRVTPESNADRRQELVKTLYEKLFAVFDSRMEIEQEKVTELRQRLQKIETRLTKREDNRDAIVERRFAELTGDATLSWDSSISQAVEARGYSVTVPALSASLQPNPYTSPVRPGSPVGGNSNQPWHPIVHRLVADHDAVNNAERKSLIDEATALQQKIQNQLKTRPDGAATKDELDSTLDILNQLKENLDALRSLENSSNRVSN